MDNKDVNRVSFLCCYKEKGTFCIHPNGTSAFRFDHKKKVVEQLDLMKNGERELLETEWPKSFKAKKHWSLHIAMNRSSRLFIYSLFRETRTRKYFMVSFVLKGRKLFICDEFYIGIGGTDQSYANFARDEKKQIYCFNYYKKESNTVFDAVKFEVEENGNITSTINENKRSLNGSWHYPFVFEGCFYWFSRTNYVSMLLRVPFNTVYNDDPEKLVLQNDFIEFQEFEICDSQTAVSEKYVFRYAFKSAEKIGILFKYDLKEKRICNGLIENVSHTHMVTESARFQHSVNGFLHVFGNCNETKCRGSALNVYFDAEKNTIQQLRVIVLDSFKDIHTDRYEDKELFFHAGETLIVKEKCFATTKYWKICKKNGSMGHIPRSFVNETGYIRVDDLGSPQAAVVLSDLIIGDLSFYEGEILTVIEYFLYIPCYWTVCKEDGSVGAIPESCVKELDTKNETIKEHGGSSDPLSNGDVKSPKNESTETVKARKLDEMEAEHHVLDEVKCFLKAIENEANYWQIRHEKEKIHGGFSDKKPVTASNGERMKRWSGKPNGPCFSMNGSGEIAFFVEEKVNPLLRVSMVDLAADLAEKTFEISLPENFTRAKRCADIVVGGNGFPYILALIGTNDTFEFVIVSFPTTFNKISITHQENTGIEDIKGSLTFFLEDEYKQIYVLNFNWEKSTTVFDAAKIYVDGFGKIIVKTLSSRRALEGFWFQPFIHSGDLYWFPGENRQMTSILKVCLSNNKLMEIKVENNIDQWPKGIFFNWTLVKVISHLIFYYVMNFDDKVGRLLVLDLKDKAWRKVPFSMHGHEIIAFSRFSLSKDGDLFLHGNCREPTCENKAHIFRMQNIVDVIDEVSSKQGQITRENSEEIYASISIFNQHYAKFFFPNLPSRNQQIVRPSQRTDESKFTPSKFEKCEELGRGGFGVVYKCFDTDAKRYFVAKETQSHSQEDLNVAENEINRLEEINHPRIVQYYGHIIVGNAITILMEYMAAGSLRQIIEKFGPVKETTSIKYIHQILEALSYIHSIGIVHCDIKCENILHDGHQNVKLGDFGIAVKKALNSKNESFFATSIKGHYACYKWAAPEILKEKPCSRRSDIWSLGCTIVEMLTGEPPYQSMHLPKFMAALGNKQLSYDADELVPYASNQMKKFLKTLLNFDVQKRPRTGSDTMAVFKEIFII